MRKQWNSVQRFSLRKFSTGLASVLLATMFMSQGVMAQTNEASENPKNTEVVNPNKETKENTVTNVQPKETEGVATGKVEAPEQPVIAAEEAQPTTTLEKEKIEEPKVAFNTTKLEALIKEVEGLDLEKYTEESVKELNVRLTKAKDALVNAKSQKEIDSAYNALVGYKNSGLKRVPKLEENNTPKPDTTNGNETVGKKAENTEPNGTNIAGHNHSLNGTTRAAGSGFRDAGTELTDVTFSFNRGKSVMYGIPGGENIFGNWVKVDISSKSDPITNISVEKGDFPLNYDKTGETTKTASVSFKGTAPSEGNWKIKITATTAKGSKSFEFAYYSPLKAPTIETNPEDIRNAIKEGNKKPNINVKVKETPGTNVPGATLKVYLVDNGGFSTSSGWGPGNPYGLHILATKEVGTDGYARITSADYDAEIGTRNIKALTVVESPDNVKATTLDERGSNFSSEIKVVADVDKTGAINAITTAAEKQNSLIESKQSVFTSTEVTDFKAMVTNAEKAAKDNINKTDTDTETKVNTEKDKGILALDKIGAIVEVEAAKKAKDAAIEGNANITDKAAAKAAIQTAADAAKTEINKDTTNTAALVTTEKEKGLLGLEKAGAVAEIDAAKAAKDAAIDTNNKLTSSEKAEVKAEVARIRNQAIADVRKATNVKAVENITNVAVEAILNARPRYNYHSNDNANHSSTTNTNHSQSDNDMMKALFAKKSEAKMLIEQEAMKKKAEISQAALSESEKALLDARVDQEKAKAFQMIDQATTIEEVNQALKAGIEAIRSIAVASANGRMTDVTPEESEEAMAQAHRQVLPQTGTGNEVAIFGAAASAILAGLGLVVPSKKKED